MDPALVGKIQREVKDTCWCELVMLGESYIV